MYRCPTCVSILSDATVRRCPVCRQNLKRRKPTLLGADRRGKDKLTSWDINVSAAASRMYVQHHAPATAPDIDLPNEHLRDSAGRTTATNHG